LLVELLQPIGFEVQQASNGQEAIAISQSWLPHLIWMDIFMPDIDGYTATQHIKSISSPAPVVIALTGSIFTDDHEGIREEYFEDFVRKPFRAEVIFEKMAIHLRIQYDYAPDEGEVHTLLQDLSLADLLTMPPDWLNKLNQAATRVNSKELLALIGQIPAEHASLIRTLTQKVQNFQFTEIKTMTEQIQTTL
jgi:CheY-like chemotaxis protein